MDESNRQNVGQDKADGCPRLCEVQEQAQLPPGVSNITRTAAASVWGGIDREGHERIRGHDADAPF